MSSSSNPGQATPDSDNPCSGRYRFCNGQPVDPGEGMHPETCADRSVVDGDDHGSEQNVTSQQIPSSPAELIAMQDKSSYARPEKPERQASAKVTQVMELIDRIDTGAAEDLEIAMRLVRRLESFHDDVVNDMRADAQANHNQLIAWAIDADRLMRARLLLESVDLE